jgi:hypothetical protein
MPKEVAAANHNADVNVNALAVGLFDGTFSVASVDKLGSPIFRFALYAAWRIAHGAKRNMVRQDIR